uniref:hypothetical protein n=1 Tax=Aquabacterium sp. TaxID=1872578 RepID=UPI0035B40CEB
VSSRNAVVSGESKCQDEIDAIADIASLRPHMQTELKGSRTPAMLKDRARPDKTQRAAIARFDQVKVGCQRRTMVQLTQRGTPPATREILESSAAAGHALRLQLARGEITFGEFNQRADALDANTRTALEPAQRPAAGGTTPPPR